MAGRNRPGGSSGTFERDISLTIDKVDVLLDCLYASIARLRKEAASTTLGKGLLMDELKVREDLSEQLKSFRGTWKVTELMGRVYDH